MASRSKRVKSDGVAPLPCVDVNELKHIYEPPAQDKTRAEYCRRYQQAEELTDVNVGGEGLKGAVSTFENSWYIATALVMTIGFAMIMYTPDGFSIKNGDVTTAADYLAIASYIILVLFGTVNSTLGVWWAGHGVAQVDWHPAASFGLFWFASLNTTLGQCQQFAKVGIVQLVLALIPLCYMHHGYFGLVASAAAVGYMYLQIGTWQSMSNLMREGYATGLSRGAPVVLDISDVPAAVGRPFTADPLSMATAQLANSFGYALRGRFGGQAMGGGKQACWRDASSGEVVPPATVGAGFSAAAVIAPRPSAGAPIRAPARAPARASATAAAGGEETVVML